MLCFYTKGSHSSNQYNTSNNRLTKKVKKNIKIDPEIKKKSVFFSFNYADDTTCDSEHKKVVKM